MASMPVTAAYETCERGCMRALLALTTLLIGCSSETYVNAHAGVTGQLTLTRRGIQYPSLERPTLTFDAGLNRRTAVLRVDVRFVGTTYEYFLITATTGLTPRNPPALAAPIEITAEFPDEVMGFRETLSLRGALDANRMYIVCDEEGQLCGIGTPDGRVQVSTSTASIIRVEGTLDFTTEPRIEER